MTAASPRSDRTELLRLWPFVRPHRRRFGLSLGILAVSFGLELLAPWLVRSAIDGPLRSGADGGFDADASTTLLGHAGALLAVILASTALGYQYALTTARAGQAVVRDLRCQVFARLLRLDPRWHDGQPSGRLVTRITTDVENLDQLVTTGALQALFDLVRLFGALAVLLAIDLRLGLFLLIALPAVGAVGAAFRRRARQAYGAVRTRVAAQNAVLTELLIGARTARTCGHTEQLTARHRQHNAATRESWDGTVRCFADFFAGVDTSLRLTQAGMLAIGAAGVASGRLTPGVLIQGWLYFQLVARPIRELGERYNVLQAALSSSTRLADILDSPEQPPAPTQPRRSPRGPATLRFTDVYFAYRPDRPVLHGVDLTVAAGRRTALVGPTGAGKTTLLALAARLHDPGRGAVLLDDFPLLELDQSDLGARVALLPQDPTVWRGTLRDNLRLLRPDAADDDLLRVLRRVDRRGGHSLLERSGGLDAPIDGSDDRRLSRGERQLLAIARVLLADPDLLLLDEATASLDSETERTVQAAMAELLRDRTVLVVAHRLATVRDADHIVVLADGRIEAQGSHQTLLGHHPRYAAMVRAAR